MFFLFITFLFSRTLVTCAFALLTSAIGLQKFSVSAENDWVGLKRHLLSIVRASHFSSDESIQPFACWQLVFDRLGTPRSLSERLAPDVSTRARHNVPICQPTLTRNIRGSQIGDSDPIWLTMLNRGVSWLFGHWTWYTCVFVHF